MIKVYNLGSCSVNIDVGTLKEETKGVGEVWKLDSMELLSLPLIDDLGGRTINRHD